MPEDLKPCPMCGKAVAKVTTSSEMFPEQDDEGNSESYAVVCDAHMPNGPGGCGASGGFAPTEAEAIAAWNRRAAPAAPDFCDGNCTWLDHAPGCVQAAPTAVEPDLFTTDIVPRPLKYPLSDYHKAMSEGPLHYTWQDKPHRLVYDLIAAVRYYATPPRTALTDEQIYGLFERTGLSKYHVRDSQVAGEYDRLILTFARAVIAASEGKP